MRRRYDPECPPVASEWLAMDEEARIGLALEFHRAAKERLPNLRAHAAFHAIVENQIAEGLDAVVRAAARLKSEGLSRHDAIHAIGSVLAEHLYELAQQPSGDDAYTTNARYAAAVERLSAKQWLKDYGQR
jgi:hypothetical protein